MLRTLLEPPSYRDDRQDSLPARRDSLTQREIEVAELLASRRTNREIAAALHLSPATVKRHTENILLKLGLHSRLDVEIVMGQRRSS